MQYRSLIIAGILLTTIAGSVSVNAQTSSAKKSGLWGAGIGAVAGGLLGGNWSDVAVGALAGGGLGYMAGNEKDKRLAEEQAAREREARARAQVSASPETAYKAPATNPFVGSTWQVISLVSDDPYPEYASMVINFPTNSKVTTMAMHKDGTAESWVETYRVVGDVMVVSGHDPHSGKDYVYNFKYSVDNDQLIVVSPESRTVLQKVD